MLDLYLHQYKQGLLRNAKPANELAKIQHEPSVLK